MNWDWEKLKDQQRKKGGGGVPPQMDEIFEKFKKTKLPGGPIVILIIILLVVAYSTIFTIGIDEVGNDTRLVLKHLDEVLLLAEVRQDPFDADESFKTAQAFVFGQEDLGHTA